MDSIKLSPKHGDTKDEVFNEDFEYLSSHSVELRPKLVEQIFAGTHEQALAILESVGPIGFIPGIGAASIPLNEFADFYGVSEKYLRGLLARRGFKRENYPDDVCRWSYSELKQKGAKISPCCNVPGCKDGMIKYHIFKEHSCMYVFLPKKAVTQSKSFFAYSPKVVLAAALYMGMVDKSGKEGNIQKTILAIKHSPYRMVRKDVEPADDQNVETDDAPDRKGIDDIRVSSNGEFILLPEALKQIVKIAAKEAAFELADALEKERV